MEEKLKHIKPLSIDEINEMPAKQQKIGRILNEIIEAENRLVDVVNELDEVCGE